MAKSLKCRLPPLVLILGGQGQGRERKEIFANVSRRADRIH